MAWEVVEINENDQVVQIPDEQPSVVDVDYNNTLAEDAPNSVLQTEIDREVIELSPQNVAVQTASSEVIEVGVATQNITTADITGDHPVLSNPANIQDLADTLEANIKPYYKSTQPVTLYLDQDNGSNTNNGLTPSSAVQTIAKVTQLVQDVYSSSQVTVNVAVSTAAYIVPFGFTRLKNVRFLGTPVVEDTRNVVANVVTNNTTGTSFTMDGAQVADDVWSGRVLRLVNFQGDARNVNVVRNTWNGTRNVIYGAMYNRGFLSDVQTAPNAAADVQLLKFPEFQFPAATILSDNVDLNFEFLKITGGSIFLNGGVKVQFLRCEIACAQIIGGLAGAAAYILSCAIANTGNATNGILGARTKGTLRLGYGNVYVPKNLTDVNNMRIKCAEDAAIEWEGGGIFRGLAGNGIFFDGGASYPLSQTALSLVFENQTGTATCAKSFSVNPTGTVTGSYYGFPKSNGGVTGSYFLTGFLDAQIKIDPTTSVSTGTVANAISADNGVTACSIGSDGTVISGGSPIYPPNKLGTLHVNYTPVGNIGTGEDTLMSYTMPAGTLGVNGDSISIEAFGSWAGNYTFSLYFGSTIISTHTATGGGNQDFWLSAEVIRKTATTQVAVVRCSHADSPTLVTITNPAETLANAVIIKGTGQGVSDNDVIQKGMLIKWQPNFT